MIKSKAAGDQFAAAAQQKRLLAAAHLHPGTRGAALDLDLAPIGIEALLIEPSALAEAPGQDPFGTEANELSGRPVFCAFPGPLAVFCTFTGGRTLWGPP